MKKGLARKITLSILAGAVLMSTSSVWAADNPDISGWNKDGTEQRYVWNGAPDGEVNQPSDKFTYDFYGAYDDSNNGATGGKVTISGGMFGIEDNPVSIYGGFARNGIAINNAVTISGGTVSVDVKGGFSDSGDAKENTVTISGGTVTGSFTGGFAKGNDNYYATATNNTVIISDGTISGSFIGGYAFEKGNAKENTVTISGGTVTGNVMGGYSDGGDVTYNTVTISGGNVTSDDEDNPATVCGGNSDEGSVNNNTINISGGTVTGFIYGGVATGAVEKNTVTISGGKVTGYVMGGYSDGGYATDNTVNISGTVDLEEAVLYGGFNGGTVSGNVLNIGFDDELKAELFKKGIDVAVGAWQNKKVQGIAGFDVINFNYINWSNGGNVVETEGLELNNTTVGKVVIGSGTVKNGEWMNLISVTGIIYGEIIEQYGKDITIRTGLTTSKTVEGDIVLDGNNIKLTINDASIATEGIVASSTGNNVPAGAEYFIKEIKVDSSAYKAIEAVMVAHGDATEKEQKAALTNMLQLGEAGGQSATAATIARNVSDATVSRMSVGGGGGHHHRGGHGPADFNEKDGSAVWAQYVHGKDKVDGMALADGVTTSYESQFNGVVLGVDFKEVGKYQSGIAFNYGEGDSHTKNIALSRSDYDFWGIGYYGAVKNADSNVIFDINYAKSDSEVKQFNSGVELEAEPETTTISAGVKVEKLIDKGAMQFVPYAGLRFMSVDTDEYSANYLGKEAFNYSADRQNIWLLPVGVSFRQENVYDSGWIVTPKVDLSYIWAFGDTENEMTVRTPDVAEAARLGYTVMNDGSFLGSIGLEAEKGDWTFGVAYSYQKSSDSRSDRWYVDAKYSF